MIFIFLLKLPIRPAQSEVIGISLATGLPCLVTTTPSGRRLSNSERHCSLNLEALIRSIEFMVAGAR